VCSVKIVTDSTSYMTPALLAKYQISEVSLIVNFGKRSFPENKEKDYHSFFEELKRSKIYPTTSQPAVGDFVETYRQLTDDGSSVISLHISGLLSGTMQAAKTAAGMLEDRDICVVDSTFTVTALAFMVEEAAKMALDGKSKEEILAQIERMKENTYLLLLVDTLEFLHRGGRIGGASALFGTLFQVKPILHLKDGIIDVLTKVRTREKAIRQLLLEVEKRVGDDWNKTRIGVLHVDNPVGGKHLKDLLQERNPEVNPDFYSVGPVIGSHVGPGTTAIVITRR